MQSPEFLRRTLKIVSVIPTVWPQSLTQPQPNGDACGSYQPLLLTLKSLILSHAKDLSENVSLNIFKWFCHWDCQDRPEHGDECDRLITQHLEILQGTNSGKHYFWLQVGACWIATLIRARGSQRIYTLIISYYPSASEAGISATIACHTAQSLMAWP